jgi:branched-chain amino acid transport system substrate-binding protein
VRAPIAALAALFVVLLLPGSSAWAAAAGAANNPSIIIGVIATLSGPGAVAGQDALDGVNTAVRELGGRFANQEVRVVAVDDRGSPDTGLAATRRLLEREKVDFVMTAVSRATMAAIIGPLIEARVFVLNLDLIPDSLAGPDCAPLVFDLGTPLDAVHEAAGALFTTEKFRRVVLIGPDGPQTDRALAAIRRHWGGEVAAVLRPRHGAARFDAEIERLRALAPDAVYTLLTGGMGLAFVRDYARSGLKADAPLIGPWTSFERPFQVAMEDAGLDILSLGGWSPDLDGVANRRFVATFEFDTGRFATGWAAQGYDAALLVESALKVTLGRTHDREALRQALRRADFTPARGTFRFEVNQGPVISILVRRAGRDAKGRPTLESRGVALREWHDSEAARCPMRWNEPPPAAARTAAKPVPPPPPVPVIASPPPAAPPLVFPSLPPASADDE